MRVRSTAPRYIPTQVRLVSAGERKKREKNKLTDDSIRKIRREAKMNGNTVKETATTEPLSAASSLFLAQMRQEVPASLDSRGLEVAITAASEQRAASVETTAETAVE